MSDLELEILQLKSDIAKFPPNGEWWKQDAQLAFEQAGIKLFYRGFSVNESVDLLRELYQAMQYEYGE